MATAKTKCTQCGRPSEPYRCRDVELGWFCVQFGLKEDTSRWIRPTPDPVGRWEQKAIDEWSEAIANAEALVDTALGIHAAARRTHGDALQACYAAGASDPKLPILVRVMTGEVPGPKDRRRFLAGRQREKVLSTWRSAAEALEEADHQLQRRRESLQDAERKAERALRMGRATDREGQ